ncbi:cyclin-dependent kinase 12 isoform X2 [Patella vulgata]|uniref:cyclin-dependent kinase 12 isoform X2 n=1 Tax=Patella vulgata TaxID=6465 RepID=UPI0024A99C99|nr:cyclin-dependent kinase 12 isoform X2 [Patella vulgata]
MASRVRLARPLKLQKKKMVGNMDTIENESLSLKSEGIYVWPSWQRSLSSRRTNRPASRGIFRGEFILLRSSPPGTLSLKNRKLSVPNRNGHLYAQRNRPCPISLPLQKHEYPTHINQMDVEDDINADDIERFFKQPLDVIPEYDNMDAKPHLYQVQEEDEDSSHELDEDTEDHSMPYPYTTQTLDRHFGLKEAQTSFSVWDRRPYRRAKPLCSSSLIDYSSDESGISTESGISSHSDEDKNGYNPSSSDESGTSKRFSDSSDSAVKDFYFISSDDEDIKLTKRKKSEFLAEIIETKVEVKAKEPPSPKLPSRDDVEVFSMSEGTDDIHSDDEHTKPTPTKPLKPSKRPTKNTYRKRNVSSSDEEGLLLSSSFTGLAPNRNNSSASESSQSSVGAPKPKIEVSPPKDIIATKPIVTESLASVLQRSMMGTGDLKHSLRSNSMKDNTCKTVFNSASLSRDNRKKTSPRPSCKTSPPPPIPTSLPPSLRIEVQQCTLPKPISQNQQLNTEVSRKGSFNSCIDIKPKSEKIQRSQSVAGYDIHEQIRKTHCSKLMDKHQTPKKSSIFSQCGDADVALVTEVHNRIGSESNSDEETYSVQKTASKIRALQDVLMKQSLPFANPFLFKENRMSTTETSPPCTKEESLKISTKSVVESTVFPPVPPPPPPPPTTLPKVKKPEPSYTKCVSYATTTKIQTGKDNCELDDATRTRIASIKCMLERASNIDEPEVSTNSKTINPTSHETTGETT